MVFAYYKNGILEKAFAALPDSYRIHGSWDIDQYCIASAELRRHERDANVLYLVSSGRIASYLAV